MNGYNVFQLYIPLKLHFKGEIDFFKYNIRHFKATSPENYEKRNDKNCFEKIGNRIPKDKTQNFLVANFLEHGDFWIGKTCQSLPSFISVWKRWEGKMSKLPYYYKADIDNIAKFCRDKSIDIREIFDYNDTHPVIFKFMMRGMIEPETFIILDSLVSFVKPIKDDILWEQEINKAVRYKPFLEYNKEQFDIYTKLIFKQLVQRGNS